MAGRRLKTSVVVNGTLYVGGDTVPAEVAAQITNPDAWESAGTDEPDTGLPDGLVISADGELLNWQGENYVRQSVAVGRVAAAEQRAAAAEGEARETREQLAAAGQAEPPAGADVEPPRSGPGSGVDAWRKYAASLEGVVIPDGAGRDEIIAAVDAVKQA